MDKPISYIIVDDEPIARNILKNYCGHLPDLRLAGEFGNALDARTSFASLSIDLVFLDINMPVLNGVAFLETLKHPPLVIFTTAYEEYAVKAFQLSVCDYLLKPFSLERFIQAVDKAKEKLHNIRSGRTPCRPNSEPGYFFIRADGKIHKLVHGHIIYAEAQGNYTKIVTTDGELRPKMSFSQFTTLLPVGTFFQVHRSFILNIPRITQVEGNLVWLGRYQVPIASPYRKSFLQAIGLPGA